MSLANAGRLLGEAGEPAAGHVLEHAGALLGSLEGDGEPGLDVGELRREVDLAARLADANRIGDAARVLVECLVNVEILAAGDPERWLELGERKRATGRLHERLRATGDHAEPRRLAKQWQAVAHARNAASHARMNVHSLKPAKIAPRVRRGIEYARELLVNPSLSSWPPTSPGRPVHLLSAFSANMLPDPGSYVVEVLQLSGDEISGLATGAKSWVGHASTAALFSTVLGRPVEHRRDTLTLVDGDVALLGQYRGPRLPEGATELPEGAELRWYRITVSLLDVGEEAE